MGDSTPSGGSAYAKDKKAFLGAIATFIASASMAVGAWAHSKISDHDTRLRAVEVQQINDGQRQQGTDSRLQRIDDKLDRILERIK